MAVRFCVVQISPSFDFVFTFFFEQLSFFKRTMLLPSPQRRKSSVKTSKGDGLNNVQTDKAQLLFPSSEKKISENTPHY